MTRLEGRQMLLGLQPLVPSAEFDVGPSTDASLGTADGGDAGIVTPVGTFCYARPIGSDGKLWFGFGVGGLAGGAFEFNDDWIGRYYLTELEFSALAAAGSLGYRLNDQWSIGGGVLIGNGVLREEAAINNVLDSIPDGLLEVDDTALGIAAAGSVLYEPTDRTRRNRSPTSKGFWRMSTSPSRSRRGWSCCVLRHTRRRIGPSFRYGWSGSG